MRRNALNDPVVNITREVLKLRHYLKHIMINYDVIDKPPDVELTDRHLYRSPGRA